MEPPLPLASLTGLVCLLLSPSAYRTFLMGSSPAVSRLLSAAFRPLSYLSPRHHRSLRFSPPPSNHRHLSSSAPPPPSSSFTNTTASFEWSDDDDDGKKPREAPSTINRPPPPPYDPFNKKPYIDEPKDPRNLQEVFHKMRTDGLTNYAVKMFDGLSKMGLTHEALELFSHIKDKSSMPDVVAHTAVLEAYADAGSHSKELLRTYERMLASGVFPNAYTYSVLVRGLARDGKVREARKYVLEMMGKGSRPDAATYTTVFEACVREGKENEGRELLEEMRGKGFVPDEKAVREHLGRRGQVFRRVMSLLFGK